MLKWKEMNRKAGGIQRIGIQGTCGKKATSSTKRHRNAKKNLQEMEIGMIPFSFYQKYLTEAPNRILCSLAC